MKSKKKTLLYAYFLGILGIHRFYVGKKMSGLLYLFTLGLGGIGWLVDCYLIITDRFTDKAGQPLENDCNTGIFKKILSGCLIVFVICIAIDSFSSAPSDVQESSKLISDEEQIQTMLENVRNNASYDLEKFKDCDPEVLDPLLVTAIQKQLPLDASWAAGHDEKDWDRLNRLFAVAEASNMESNRKSIFKEKQQSIQQMMDIAADLREKYEPYVDDPENASHGEFSDVADTLDSKGAKWSRAQYMDFYVWNGLDVSAANRLEQFFTGETNLKYYYATNVKDYGLLGLSGGDEDYVIATEQPFAEAGVCTLLVYQDGTTTLSSSKGFEMEVKVFRVVDPEAQEELLGVYEACGLFTREIEEILSNLEQVW